MAPRETITVFGGTGFVGRHVVRLLAQAGYTVKVPTRAPESAYFLKPCGVPGQIVPLACDTRNPESLRAAVAGSVAVVNTIGILFEKRRNTFGRLHAELPGVIGRISAQEGVQALVHVSALGIETNPSRYARSKREGETALLREYPGAIILRPSVIFGPEDNFFNMFARLTLIAPALPLIGGGRTKFQPVYVGDVAQAVMTALHNPACAGHIYELGGPETVTLRQVFEKILYYTGRRRWLVPVPFWAARLKAFFLNLLPRPLLTPDQVESLKTDNVVTPGALGCADLGIAPTGLSLVLPRYLETYRQGGRFAAKKQA